MKFHEAVKAFRHPSLDECRLLMARAGLPEIEGDKFYHFYESKGWRVGKTPMKSLASAVARWRIEYEQKQKPSSVWELKTIAEELRKKADAIACQYSYEDHWGMQWKDQGKKAEHRLLLLKIQNIQEQIIGKA